MKLERRNAYYCNLCKRTTITVDVAVGVTPMFILCPHCNSTASSFMYQLPGCMHFDVKAEYEWYKPDEKEFEKLTKGEQEHVRKDGLLMRLRTKAEPIYKEISGISECNKM